MKLTRAQFQAFCCDCTNKTCPYRRHYAKMEKCPFINDEAALAFWLEPIVIEDEDDK